MTAPDGVKLEDIAVANEALNMERTHQSHVLGPDVLRDPHSFTDAYRKKATALLIGYNGTSFKGNTVNHELERGQTVDDVLEDALFKAGCVKLSNYRSRALGRLKWSRSSRTDKGVSSLATVVSCRLEVDPAVWDVGGDVFSNDPSNDSVKGDLEGQILCSKINNHLPNSVKVFAAYSTPKSFQARRACVKRTYDYLLPARCLGISGCNDGSETRNWPGTPWTSDQTQAETFEKFRAALSCFEGSHYFHNYTKRAVYSRRNDDGYDKKRRGKERGKDKGEDDDFLESEVDEVSDESIDDEKANEDENTSSEKKFIGSKSDGIYWLLERDDNDLVGIKHNRRISSFTAGDVETLGSDVETFIRVTVRGDSFMLYQIRKMIATAVAVALGHYPLELVPVTLARPARIVTPIAPPMTLYLHEAEFVPFAQNKTGRVDSKSNIEKGDHGDCVPNESATSSNPTPPTPDPTEQKTLRGRMERLSPSDTVREYIEEFRMSILDPALGPALQSDEWDAFTKNLFLSRIWKRDEKGTARSDAVEEVLEAFKPYAVERAARKAELREMDRVRLEEEEAVKAASNI